MNFNDWNLVLIVWFPHSGCRWLNRSLLSKHTEVTNEEFFLPYLTHSTDMILNLDRTSQVHKSRSMSDLKDEFEMVQEAVQFGREQGVEKYLHNKFERFKNGKHTVCIGALSPGAPEPLLPDLESVVKAKPNVKILHLVRNPVNCYKSMQSRSEMDSDPYKIGGLWASFNSYVRNFGKQYGDNYFCLKYEDLKSSTPEALKKLSSWIGIDYQEAMVEGITEYHGKNKNKEIVSSEGDVDRVQELTSSESNNYGY